MFTLDATIDAVQGAKKQFVSTFVQNEAIAAALNDFVDAQTEYTKKAVKTTMDATTVVTQEMVKTVSEAAKVDYTKVSEGFTKAVAEMSKQAEKVTKAFSKKSA